MPDRGQRCRRELRVRLCRAPCNARTSNASAAPAYLDGSGTTVGPVVVMPVLITELIVPKPVPLPCRVRV